MTLAEKISESVLQKMHFVDPRNHGEFARIVAAVQDEIDREMDTMERLAGENAVPSQRAILEYEIMTTWWTGLAFGSLLQELGSTYMAWKVRRKYQAYMRMREITAPSPRRLGE